MTVNQRIFGALSVLLGITVVGTIGFIVIEKYDLFDALYMTVITLSTVGFGEVNPLSGIGRLFTTFLIMVGFAGLAFAAHGLVESLIEKVWNRGMETKRMKKKISSMKSHYIICGLGRVGAAAAEYLKQVDASFVVIETNPDNTQMMRETGYLFIEGDATHEKTLLDAGIKKAAGLMALLNSDPDNLFVVLTARELNPTLHIISRADDSSSDKKIFRAGADNVVSPYATSGRQIAGDILAATGRPSEAVECSPTKKAVPRWLEVKDGSSMINQTVAEISSEMGEDIIGLRREGKDTIFPDQQTTIIVDDILLIIDDAGYEESAPIVQQSTGPQKIVIIDDNPVIVRLYTRLLQKSGFYPISALDGREGLETIIREKPQAAIIDFMLPIMSGIDICSHVRASDIGGDMRLVLYTSDTNPETKKKALAAGADDVVLKGPDASELIDTVVKLLKRD
jgi:voltage-gated potassium channel